MSTTPAITEQMTEWWQHGVVYQVYIGPSQTETATARAIWPAFAPGSIIWLRLVSTPCGSTRGTCLR